MALTETKVTCRGSQFRLSRERQAMQKGKPHCYTVTHDLCDCDRQLLVSEIGLILHIVFLAHHLQGKAR